MIFIGGTQHGKRLSGSDADWPIPALNISKGLETYSLRRVYRTQKNILGLRLNNYQWCYVLSTLSEDRINSLLVAALQPEPVTLQFLSSVGFRQEGPDIWLHTMTDFILLYNTREERLQLGADRVPGSSRYEILRLLAALGHTV